jgi:hypothetical protein
MVYAKNRHHDVPLADNRRSSNDSENGLSNRRIFWF